MIPEKQVIDGVKSFVLNDVLPGMPNGVSKFVAYAALGAMSGPDSVNRLIAPYRQTLQSVGVLCDDGVDPVALKGALDTAFANVPTVSLWGFTFNTQDKDKLVRRIGL